MRLPDSLLRAYENKHKELARRLGQQHWQDLPMPVDIARKVFEPDGILLGTVDGQPLRVPPEMIMRHSLFLGASGGGKTRYLGVIIEALLAKALVRGETNLPLALWLIDPKSETARQAKVQIADAYRQATPAQRELLREVVFSFELGRDAVTPSPLRTPDGLTNEYHALIEVDAISRAHGRWPEGVQFLLGETLKALLELEWPLNVPIIDRLLRDDTFRRSVTQRLRDRHLQHFFWELHVPKPTIDALIRRLSSLMSFRQVRASLGSLPHTSARTPSTKVQLIDTGAGATIPPSISLSMGSRHVADATLTARRRDGSERLLLAVDELPAVLGDGNDSITEVVETGLRVLRSAGTAMVCIAQSLDALPKSVVQTLETNSQNVVVFQSRRETADLLAPHVVRPANLPEREHRRLLEREIESLPPQHGYIWMKGQSGVRFRAADFFLPSERGGPSDDELLDLFRSEIAPRSTRPIIEIEREVAEWEATVLLEHGVSVVARDTRPEGSIREILEGFDEDPEEPV